MTEYTIAPSLYAQALDEIRAGYLKKNPISEKIQAILEDDLVSYARTQFLTAWQNATQLWESHKSVMQTLQQSLTTGENDPRLAELSDEMRAQMIERLAAISATVSAGRVKLQEQLDKTARASLMKMFVIIFVSETTAKQIVENHIIAS